MLHYRQPHTTPILCEKCFVYAAANAMQNAGLLAVNNPVDWTQANAVDLIIQNDNRKGANLKNGMGGGPMMLINYLRARGTPPAPYTAITATHVTESTAGVLNGFVGVNSGLVVGVEYKMGTIESKHWIFVDTVTGLAGGGFQFNFIDQQNPTRTLTLKRKAARNLKNGVIHAINAHGVQDSTYTITTVMRIH